MHKCNYIAFEKACLAFERALATLRLHLMGTYSMVHIDDSCLR